MTGQLAKPLPRRDGSATRGISSHHGAASREAAVAEGNHIRVSVNHANVVDVNAQLVSDNLGEGSLEALANISRAGVHADQPRPVEGHPRILPGAQSGLLHVGSAPDPNRAACRPQSFALGAQVSKPKSFQ